MDELTRLLAPQDLPPLITALARRGQAILGIWLDIDGLRGVNNEYGWQVADDTLRRFGRWLAEKAVSMDATAIRVGGDEFLILLVDATKAQAREEARRLVAASQAIGLPFAECTVFGLTYASPRVVRSSFSVSAAVTSVDEGSGAKLRELGESMAEAIWRAKQRCGSDFGVVAEEADHQP